MILRDQTYKEKLIYLSLPISGISIFLKYKDFYLTAGIVLLIAMICSMSFLYISNSENGKTFRSSALSSLGFIIITFSAITADTKHLNLIFLLGVAFLAVFSEINFSLISVLVYTFMTSLLNGSTEKNKIVSLLIAVFIIILANYFSDFMSLIYICLTMLSLYLVAELALNGLSFINFFTTEKLVNLLFIFFSLVSSFILYLNKNRFLKVIASPTEEKEKEADQKKNIQEEELNDSTEMIKIEENVSPEIPLMSTEKEEEKQPEMQINSSFDDSSTNLETRDRTEAEKEVLPISAEVTTEKKKSENLIDYSVFMSEKTFLFVLVKSNEALFDISMKRAKVCSEIAEMIGANSSLALAGSFFADCGKLNSQNYIKESLKLIKQYGLPEEILTIAKEHHFKFGKPSSRESAITMLLFKLDSSIHFFETQGKKFKVEPIINNVTDSLLMAGKLDYSELSISEYKFIKDYLMEEVPKLYDYFT